MGTQSASNSKGINKMRLAKVSIHNVLLDHPVCVENNNVFDLNYLADKFDNIIKDRL